MDLISRQAAIELIHSLYPSAPIMRMNRKRWEEKYRQYIEIEKALERLPSAQQYTDEEIQKMQDMEQAQLDKAFELGREDAQPEIIHCKDCRWQKDQSESTAWLPCRAIVTPSDFYCGRAERRTDEQT